MNYIGSKYSLLDEIGATLDSFAVPTTGVAFDAFAGTGAVSQFLKARGHIVYANDWQHYSYMTNRAFLSLNEMPRFPGILKDRAWKRKISDKHGAVDARVFSVASRDGRREKGAFAQVISYLNELPGERGEFYDEYCEGGQAGRCYYSKENGLRIQAIRDCIEQWLEKGLIDDLEHSWLVASVVESADRVANTASVYAAFLKHVKKSAQKPLELLSPEPTFSVVPSQDHRVFRGDVLEVLSMHSLKDHVLTYIDPPYNHRQYASYYHILETISRWDMSDFSPRLKTGLRKKDENLSPFCMKQKAYGAFDQLLGAVKSRSILFSYNNEGVLRETELLDLFEAHFGKVDFRKVDYQRFRADNDSEMRNYKRDATSEFLIFATEKRRSPRDIRMMKEEVNARNSGGSNSHLVARSRRENSMAKMKGWERSYPYYKIQVFNERFVSWKDEKPQFESLEKAKEATQSKRLRSKKTRIVVVEGPGKRKELTESI